MRTPSRFLLDQVSAIWRKIAPPIVVSTTIDHTLFNVSLRDHLAWIYVGQRSSDHEKIPFPENSVVWDLGCNIGLHSVSAARKGNNVVAFDISETNILCLAKTAKEAGLNIRAVWTPVAIRKRRFFPAKTGFVQEKIDWHLHGTHCSITYKEAADLYGMPKFIKIDIEGGELEFLTCQAFKDWVFKHEIEIYLELHPEAADYLWPEFKQVAGVNNDHWHLTHENSRTI